MSGSSFTAEQVLTSLSQAVIATDLTGVIVSWNPAAERLYGWTEAEAMGRDVTCLDVPPTARAVGGSMRLVHEGGMRTGAITVRAKDGSTFPALVTSTAVRDAKDAVVGIVGISAELGVALRPLLAQSSDGALVLTPDALVAYLSPAATRLFGWTNQDTLGRELWTQVHPDDLAVVLEYHRGVAADSGFTATVECRVLRTDGDWCWADLLLTNLIDDPAVGGMVCRLRDITERVHVRENGTLLIEQLQRALTSRVVIEQAKGMLAERHGTDADAAFAMLRRHARNENLKLHDVARSVVAGERQLPL